MVGALIMVPLGIMRAGNALCDFHVLALGLPLALLASAIPFNLEMVALRRLSPAAFGVLTSGEPAVGAIVAALILGETLPFVKWSGLIAIGMASVGTSIGERRRLAALDIAT